MTLDRVASTPNAPSSWMVDSLFNLVGGVAGTLIKFCTVPFRGFQAGGGQSYDADAQIKIASKLGLHDEPEPNEPAAPVQHIKLDTRPSPSDDYGICSIESVDTERPRMPKRLRTEDAWVMVGADEETTASPIITPRISERRMPAPTYTPSPSQIPRPLSRMSATPVSKRPSLIPVSRRSGGTRTPLYNSSSSGSKSHNRQRSHSRLSFGSPGKPDEKRKISPLPPDSQKLVSRIRREEMEDDARMRRMSSQMSAMLKEAREALGSKVEIEDDDDDMMS
ncbi:hypothetical protein N0V86_008623 [Didymella sp. IMI 355093]|nr:hypothetical protein N0V86_008623 [Didymella sp. IMI 355093]